ENNEMFTTCGHEICPNCLLSTFLIAPKLIKIPLYVCPKPNCNELLPPQCYFLLLSRISNFNYSPNINKQQLQQQKLILCKNILKILGQVFSKKLIYYPR